MKRLRYLFPTFQTRFRFVALLLLTLSFGSASLALASAENSEKRIDKNNPTKKSGKKPRKTANRKKIKSKKQNLRRKLRASIPQPQTEEFEGDAEKRREWFISQRTFPFDELPEDARHRAFDSRPAEASLSPEVLQWQPIGPKPTSSYFPGNWGLTSGRINAVAVSTSNPNLVLIGGATGGVWRSTDGGANFVSTSDNQVDLAVGSIVFAPSDNSIVYAGMGDVGGGYLGTGLLKSTDGGATWARISNTSLPSVGMITKVEVDPTNPNRVYVAQNAGGSSRSSVFSSGVWVSADGGVNWTRTLVGLARDIVRHPTQANILYAALNRLDGATPNTAGVWKSTNSGASWTRVYTSPFSPTSNVKIAVTPAAPANLYVLVGGSNAARLEVSANEGGAWSNRGSNFDVGQIGYNCYLFVNPANADTIYVGTRDLWRSTNGGTNFTNMTGNFGINGAYNPFIAKSHPDQHHLYISPSNPNTIYIANDGGLWKTTDGASTFSSLNSTLGLTMFVSYDMHPTDPTRSYGGTQDNGTQKRSGNQSWREFSTGDGGQTFVDPLDPSIVYSTYVYHTIYRNTDHGEGNETVIGKNTTFAGDRVAFYPPFVGNDSDSNLYFGTYRLYISTNGGANWAAPGGTTDLTFGGTLSAIGVAKSNTNFIYTGSNDGRLMVSINGGASWTDRTAGLPQRFIKSIIVSPTDPNTAFVTVSGFGSGHVFKTINAGANWTNISGNLPDIPTNTLLIDPRPGQSNTLYVGTDIGVFRSTTGGTTWETFNNGLPPTIVSELDAQPTGLMQAGTYGRGAYEINLNVLPQNTVFDFDGDGKTDVSIFRLSNATWYIDRSQAGFIAAQWGISSDLLAPADFDGDGKTDYAVFRSGAWYISQSSNGQLRTVQFGQAGDLPRPGDFDGDGKADISVFRPSNGTWYRLNSTGGQFAAAQFGTFGDHPLMGDFDGDGRADLAVTRLTNGSLFWYRLNSSNNQFVALQFGQAGDIPAPGDFDGDEKTDVSIFRPSNGAWYRTDSLNGQFIALSFGQFGDSPVVGDFDGDRKADISVYRPTNFAWYRLNSGNGAFSAQQFGAADDKAIPAAYLP